MRGNNICFAKLAARATSTFLIALCFAWPSQAQQQDGRRRTTPTNPAEKMRARQRQMIEREAIFSAPRQPAPKRLSEREQKLILKQIKEDYEGIQSARNELMRAVTAQIKGAPDYKRIADRAAEINKRATRLREVLALPRLYPNEQETSSPQEVKADLSFEEWTKLSILQLGNHIRSFISNPHFKNPGVVNVTQTIRASRDLETIIETSKRLKETVKKLAPQVKG